MACCHSFILISLLEFSGDSTLDFAGCDSPYPGSLQSHNRPECSQHTYQSPQKAEQSPSIGHHGHSQVRCFDLRAVLMLTRKDLLAQGLQGVAVLLDDMKYGSLAKIIKTVKRVAAPVSAGAVQRSLRRVEEAAGGSGGRDMREAELQGFGAGGLPAGPGGPAESVNAAAAGQQGPRGGEQGKHRLAMAQYQQLALQAEIDRLKGQGKEDLGDAKPPRAVHICADPKWNDTIREPLVSVGNTPSTGRNQAGIVKASSKDTGADLALLKSAASAVAVPNGRHSPGRARRPVRDIISPRRHLVFNPTSPRPLAEGKHSAPSVADRHTLSSQNKVRQKSPVNAGDACIPYIGLPLCT
eukprot:scaffold160888_cov48-Prasinocladus_malaysianus.AAC.2